MIDNAFLQKEYNSYTFNSNVFSNFNQIINYSEQLRQLHEDIPFFLIYNVNNNNLDIKILEELISYAKKEYINVIVFSQIDKIKSVKIKHMVDSIIHLRLCDKKLMNELQYDLTGIRILSVEKNRFGPRDASFFLDLQNGIFLEKFRSTMKINNITQSKQEKHTGINFIDDALGIGKGFTPSAITLFTDKIEYYLQQILNYESEDGFVEKFRSGIKNEPKINLTKQENYLKNILTRLTSDECIKLINQIADHAKFNDWTVNQAFNLAQFGLLLPEDMLVYMWNQITKCKHTDNIIKFHSVIGNKLIDIINRPKSIKNNKIQPEIINEPSFDFKNNVNEEYEDEPFFDISRVGQNREFEDEPKLVLKKEYKFKIGNKILSERQFRKLIKCLL